MKAYQNIASSLLALQRLSTLIMANDHISSSAMFHVAVIRYAKPFLNSEYDGNKICYPIKHLKKEDGFDIEAHKHILNIRNTLIAHDDFDEIEPRILSFGVSFDQKSCPVPTTIVASNKCISHPANLESINKLLIHVAAATQGAHRKLEVDICALRAQTIKDPAQAAQSARYINNYGEPTIRAEGLSAKPLDPMSDNWLNAEEPCFTYMNNGYIYEEARYRKDFHGPEEILLPDGRVVMLAPNSTASEA